MKARLAASVLRWPPYVKTGTSGARAPAESLGMGGRSLGTHALRGRRPDQHEDPVARSRTGATPFTHGNGDLQVCKYRGDQESAGAYHIGTIHALRDAHVDPLCHVAAAGGARILQPRQEAQQAAMNAKPCSAWLQRGRRINDVLPASD